MKTSTAAISVLLISTALTGDYIVFKSKYSNSEVFRAVTDVMVHGILGGVSATIFLAYDNSLIPHWHVAYIILCTLLSSLIDIDHAFVARSFHWKDISNVKHRGMFHATSLWIFVVSLIMLRGYIFKNLNIYTFSMMLLISGLSHHIRDANRRGFWIPPFGSTLPLNKFLYVLCLSTLPHLLAYIYQYTKFSFYKHQTVYQGFVV